MSQSPITELPIVQCVRASLRADPASSAQPAATSNEIFKLAASKGENHAIAYLVAPWLMPFVDWETLIATIIPPTNDIGSSKSIRNAQILLHHLLNQDLNFLMKERSELLETLDQAIASIGGPFSEQAFRNALTYPFLDDPTRVDVLMGLSEAIASREVSTSDQEEELIALYETIF